MEIQTTKIERLSWDFPQFGYFQAVLTDNQLSKIELYRVTGQENGALCTDDLEYVKAVHHALGELLKHIERDNTIVVNQIMPSNQSMIPDYTPQP